MGGAAGADSGDRGDAVQYTSDAYARGEGGHHPVGRGALGDGRRFVIGRRLERGSESVERECGIRAPSDDRDRLAMANSHGHDPGDAPCIAPPVARENGYLRVERLQRLRQDCRRARMQSMAQPHRQLAPSLRGRR